MAVSRDFRQFDFSQQLCFNTLLALLPFMYVRVEPFTSALMQIELQNPQTGEIRTKAQSPTATNPLYYRYKFSCLVVSEHSCKVQLEAATLGITDIGLGQLTLRQLLITLNMALIGKLPPGTLPLFLLKPSTVEMNSEQRQFEAQINQAFQMCKKGQPAEALTQFQAAVTLKPFPPDIHFFIGVLLMLLGYLPEAAKAFKQTLHHNHHHLLAQAYLDDVQIRIRQNPPIEIKKEVKNQDNPESGTPAPQISTTFIPGTGQAPGNNQLEVNPNNIETLSFKAIQSYKLTIREAAEIKEYELSQNITTIGRHEKSDILLNDLKVSRHHAEIAWKQGSYTLVDLDSANGTLYNGQPLPPKQAQHLYIGDVIKLGDVEITFGN